MNNLLQLATGELNQFLTEQLPSLSENWWNDKVISCLSFPQQRRVHEYNLDSLDQLDFAALLRIIDQNWYELSNKLNLPREGRSWIKELQTVRNKWAHLSTQALDSSETYRDIDTLSRMLTMINSSEDSINKIELAKAEALVSMAQSHHLVDTSPKPTVEEITIPDKPKIEIESDSVQLAPQQTKFKIGDLVALLSDSTAIMPVIEVIDGGDESRYRVFSNNKIVTYYESQLQTPPSMDRDHTCLGIADLQAYLTSLQLISPSTGSLFSLRSGRVKFVPYQYRPVLKLIRADRPRLLIADEVGVGKTIEAGLIIKELRARTDISSVLIICPKALVAERKWFVEMKRFDETFTALDGSMLRHCLHETDLDGEWPEQYEKSIVPFSLFDSDLLFGSDGKRKRKGLLDLDPPPKFDLVIVDEAHHIRNSKTYLHQAVRYFCDNAQAAVFLTATPVQLGSEDLFTLLNVLRPDLVIDKASFEHMAEPNREINTAVQHCRATKSGWQNKARACLDTVARTNWGRLFIRESPAFQGVYDQLQEKQIDDGNRIAITRAIEDLYTFGPLINRTRRRDIGEFTTRKSETLAIKFTPKQQIMHDDILSVISRILMFCHGQQNVKFMMTTVRRQAASCLYGLAPLLRNILVGKLDNIEVMETIDNEQELDLSFVEKVRPDIENLLSRADDLDINDPKVEAFIKVLLDKNKMPNNKGMVFSTFRHTLAYLAEHMEATDIRFGVVHGGVKDDDRAELRHRFALPKEHVDAIDVLLSSEVGCEGLDFQFCDLLINYDLPWNPMRIEQRIGRIDRYGQKSEAVAIVNMITPGTVDADIYERCLLRIGVFQHAVGGGEEILGEVTKELHDIADSFSLTPDERAQRLQQLGDNGIRQIQEEQALEEQQAELFGLTVPKQSWRQEIEDAESSWLSPSALQCCVTTYLSEIMDSESEFLLGNKNIKTLRASKDARSKLLNDFKKQRRATDLVSRQWEKWLKGTQPTLPVTFDQSTAADTVDVVHLNVLHPLVRQAAAYLEHTEPIHVNISASHSKIPAGNYPFSIYQWRKRGVRADEELVSVTFDSALNAELMQIIPKAFDSETDAKVDASIIEKLDQQHHTIWSDAQANHIAENREFVDHRIQSLNVSHQARCKLLEDQIQRATDDKIRRMKKAELMRADQDYESRLTELEQSINCADIHAAPVVFGILHILGT